LADYLRCSDNYFYIYEVNPKYWFRDFMEVLDELGFLPVKTDFYEKKKSDLPSDVSQTTLYGLTFFFMQPRDFSISGCQYVGAPRCLLLFRPLWRIPSGISEAKAQIFKAFKLVKIAKLLEIEQILYWLVDLVLYAHFLYF
jgi:hypothetical protein